MKSEICAPRIFGRAIFAGLMLLGSTFAFAHNPGTTDESDAKAAAAQLQRDPGSTFNWKASSKLSIRTLKMVTGALFTR